METRRHLEMEESFAEGQIEVQVQAEVSAPELRSVASPIRVSDYRLQKPNSLAGKTDGLQAFAGPASNRHDDVGCGSRERHHKSEDTRVPAATVARPVDQKVLHDEPQLETEGVRSVNVAALFALLEAQEYRCALSGRQLTPKNVVIDHINPFSICNEHSIDNVQLLVSEANKAKGCMSNESFIELCRDVAARHPPATGLLDSSAA